MRLCVILFLVLAACAPVVPQVRQDSTALPFAVVDERELIVLTAEPPQTLIGRAEALGYRLQAVHPLPDLGDTLVSLRIPDGTSIPQAIGEIEAAVPGVTAGANHVYRLQAIDRTDGRNYAARMIGWPPQGCRARVRVGMVDAGVGASHPGLTDGRIDERGFVGGASDTRSNHGTVVAELLIGPTDCATPLSSARA